MCLRACVGRTERVEQWEAVALRAAAFFWISVRHLVPASEKVGGVAATMQAASGPDRMRAVPGSSARVQAATRMLARIISLPIY